MSSRSQRILDAALKKRPSELHECGTVQKKSKVFSEELPDLNENEVNFREVTGENNIKMGCSESIIDQSALYTIINMNEKEERRVENINNGDPEMTVEENKQTPDDTTLTAKWEISQSQELGLRIRRVGTIGACDQLVNEESADEIDDSDKDPDFEVSSTSSDESSTENNINLPNNDGAEEYRVKKGKKAVADPKEWKKNKAKFLRNKGKAYVSTSKRKTQIRAREMGPPCTDKCKLGCSKKITHDQRQTIFSKYWSLKDLSSQRGYIARSMREVRPLYQYKKEGSKRLPNHVFSFTIDGEDVRVCKKFFKATLDINDRPIRTVVSKSKEDGFLLDDFRGKHGQHSKTDPALKDSIRTHINEIPRLESHYLRAQSTREYIEGGKTLSDLYRDYKSSCIEKNISFANQTMYSRIFNTEYNISFFSPKKDQCDLCTAFKNSEGDEKENLKEKYDTHLIEKMLTREAKKCDKERQKYDQNLLVATYDLQAVLPAPKGEVSVFYYKSKLNCYNFTISDINLNKTECFFWHEGEGNRGAIEIGSCVLKYLEHVAQIYDNENLEVVFFSDNCCGQQKNKYVMSMYLYAVQVFKLKSISHKFLIRGHTQNEGDNVHSVIEKEVKKSLKSGPIYTPLDYIRIIKSAKKSGTPYEVTEMVHSDFVDLKKLAEQVGTNYSKTLENEIIKTTDMKMIMVQKSEPGVLFVKTSYEQNDFKRICVKNRRTSEICQLKLVPAYLKKLTVSVNKKSGIQDLLSSNYIPKFYESFYKSVFE